MIPLEPPPYEKPAWLKKAYKDLTVDERQQLQAFIETRRAARSGRLCIYGCCRNVQGRHR